MLPYIMIAVGVVLRLTPHPPNFAPIGAMALFGGAYLGRITALGIPLLAMLVSDFFIGFYNPLVMASVYGSFLLIGVIGIFLRKRKTPPYVLGAALSSSVLFYLITNFAVWAVPGSFYPHNLAGLASSYINAIPFLKNTLMGNLFYTGAFFGVYELAASWLRRYAGEKRLAKLLLPSQAK